MILALEIDGSDTEVIGLYSDMRTAVDSILAKEREAYAATGELDVFKQERAEFLERVQGALEQEHGAIDLQIESPFLSVDLQFKSIELSA